MRRYDIAILGAGPAGCVTALACARRGQSVLLLEADPRPSERPGGEWLHPAAVAVLDTLGVDLTPSKPYATGRGWVIHPDDGSEPVVLPYPDGTPGFACDHATLLETLRAHAARTPGIEYVPWARGTRVVGQELAYVVRAPGDVEERAHSIEARRIIGASGRSPDRHETRAHSRTVGLVLRGVRLPYEGHQHFFLGGPGPVVAHRIAPDAVRVFLDVPMSFALPPTSDRAALGLALSEAFHSVLPAPLRAPFAHALRTEPLRVGYNEIRPRGELGREGLVLVGDAAGNYHPLTSAGLVLAFEDALAVAEHERFDDYTRARTRDARMLELLAIALYEVFTDDAEATVAVRRAIVRMWRGHPSERVRTMAFLSGRERGLGGSVAFATSLGTMIARGARDLAVGSLETRRFGRAASMVGDLGERIGWLLFGSLRATDALAQRLPVDETTTAEERYGAALRASRARAEVIGLERSEKRESASRRVTPRRALERAFWALEREQDTDGSFEGEVVWNAMLPAQYVLAMHAMGRSIGEVRARRILRQFEVTEHPMGGWGLHPVSPPYLFVTTLVYVASRLLGVAADDARLRRAHAFIRHEGGAECVPSWGKFWLALVGLYDWRGVSPVLPEAWSLPTWSPIHPSRYYCHTRQIYMAMATLYGERFVAPVSTTIEALRGEIFTRPFAEVDFDAARTSLRDEEIFTPHTSALRAMFAAMRASEALREKEGLVHTPERAAILRELREHIRYELRSTHYTCISPVSGLLDMLALHAADPGDTDLGLALAAFEGWIWEDDELGTRIAGARSASWDTAFALQALAAAYRHLTIPEGGARVASADPAITLDRSVRRTMIDADAFLASQQIRSSTGREGAYFRLDPRGGYCFAGVWHGWPVSDCTAEAILARLESPLARPSLDDLVIGVEFMLRTQNSDGGFGSYEARRVDVPLEWMNPAEMFGDSMTEHTYVECTASCIAALAAFRRAHPTVLRDAVDRAIARGLDRLRALQRPDGSWAGVWGVLHTYGTMFGVRGLLAGGVPAHDPAVRRACAFLKSHQRSDGGWGEHHASIHAGRYVEHHDGQFVQTAWALSALVEAEEPDFSCLERAARFLAERQNDDGTWSRQDPEGLFFHTALLDYALYRRYFPLWALALFESRREARARFGSGELPPFEPYPPEARPTP